MLHVVVPDAHLNNGTPIAQHGRVCMVPANQNNVGHVKLLWIVDVAEFAPLVVLNSVTGKLVGCCGNEEGCSVNSVTVDGVVSAIVSDGFDYVVVGLQAVVIGCDW